MSIEKNFDIPFISSLALHEKQIQQNYRPIIAVHKWFARRPGTLFRGLLLSEFVNKPLQDTFYSSNNLSGLVVVDPFMGGGTPIVEANRIGCDVIGYDINPMAYWIVRQEIEHLDLKAYRKAADELVSGLEQNIGSLYHTTCLECGSRKAHVKYFLWVKQHTCANCGKANDLFPGYLLAEDKRHPENIYVCASCGELNGVKDRHRPGKCKSCGERILVDGPAKRSKYECKHCGKPNFYSFKPEHPPTHRMYAMEYHCKKCKPQHEGRFFKKPSRTDLAKYTEATNRLNSMKTLFVPDDIILGGDETARLHRWGYQKYREMFNLRQLLGLELSCRAIADVSDERVRNALATNLSDLLRYQNMLCRYDSMALKSLDIFSVHGFPVGLVQCESNFLGIINGGGMNVGSGGWANIIEKYYKAKAYCDAPFEIRHEHGRKIQVPVRGEWIGDQKNGTSPPIRRQVRLLSQSSMEADLQPRSVDAVFTDPPYYSNVQYAELMDFCYVWLRKLVGTGDPAFARGTTRDKQELTGNVNMERGLDYFTEGLSVVFCKMAQALKPGHPMVFTYHHNSLEAYYPIAIAMLDSSLVCSASLPCPAEMGASIHISGTGSSIVDTVFVCRSTGSVPARWLANTPRAFADLVRDDVRNLRQAGVKETRGDVRCIIYGHFTRLAVWHLRHTWDNTRPVQKKTAALVSKIEEFGGLEAVERHVSEETEYLEQVKISVVREKSKRYGAVDDEIFF
ncbi:MAG: DNA methylase [Thermodesulfobacteriota bacterium]|jgi:adenine-specific DNA methylase